MEALTASSAQLVSSLHRLTAHFPSWPVSLDSLPPSLPVTPCVLAKNTLQIPIPNSYYFLIFFICGGGLYVLLLLPFSLWQKRFLAAPLWVGLLTGPVIFTSIDAPALQLINAAACGCVLMRMLDLYYVRPWRIGKEPTMNLEDWWTEIWQPFRKVPMSKDQLQRFELEMQQSRLRRELEKYKQILQQEQEQEQKEEEKKHRYHVKTSVNQDSVSSTPLSSRPSSPSPADSDGDRSNSSGTAVVTPKLSKDKSARLIYSPKVDPNPQHWSAYLPRWIFYAVLMDIVPFILSFFTFEQIQNFSLVPTLLSRVAVASMVIFDISLGNYTIMILWATITGDLIRDTEWTLVRHYFPGFATSPAEFWRQWHHLFKYVWVDLGFKPVLHILRKHVTPRLKNKKVAKAMETVLPVMGVFLMSGLMHEYIVVAMWHSRPGPMTAFFLLQGAATILSKALNDTVGHKIKVPNAILITLTWVFNLWTSALFMEPVFKTEGYNMLAHQSFLISGYNYLRSHGVF